MGHTANFAIEMIQVSTKISSWTQKCGGIFVFLIEQKIKELFQLFEGPGEVKLTLVTKQCKMFDGEEPY